MTRPRVALLADSLRRNSGWGRYAAELGDRLPAAGFDVSVIETSALPTTHLPFSRREPLLSLDHGLTLAQHAAATRRRAADCAIVHALNERLAPLACLVAGRRPFVLNAYGTFATRPLTRWHRRIVAAATYRRAAAIACISHYTERRILELLPEARTVVVRSGVDVEHFGGAPAHLARDAAPVILSIGALKPRKGHDVILEALPRVIAAVPSVEWHIIGKADYPDYAARLEARTRELGLTRSVRFLGGVDERTLRRELQQCAVFALTSVNADDAYEGYPLVFGEAAACGKPAIATTGNGSEEAVVDGVTGILVGQKDVAATAAALIALLTDAALRERLGRGAYSRAVELTWDKTAQAFAAVYRKILDARLGAPLQ